jgi:hypothetical protein
MKTKASGFSALGSDVPVKKKATGQIPAPSKKKIMDALKARKGK